MNSVKSDGDILKILNFIKRNWIMFLLGCAFYTLIEMFWRGYSFREMSILGGLIFIVGGLLNNKFSWKMDLLLQCGIISVMITISEAIIGNIDYYFLHKNMWNYSNLPLSYLNGKICVPFTIIWFLMGFIIIFVHDAITYYWMHEGEQPEYWIFKKRIWKMPKRNCELH